MVQGALLCPGLPGKTGLGDARAIVRRFALAHRAARSASSGTGPIAVPVSRLICGRASSARSGSGSRLAPRYRSLHSGTGSTGTRWSGPGSGGQLADASADAARESWYIPVRSVVCDWAESAERSRTRPSTCGPISAGRPGLPSRCRASTGAANKSQTRLPIVWSSMIWRSWPPRPSATVNSQRPAYAASSLAAGPGRPRTQRCQREPRLTSA